MQTRWQEFLLQQGITLNHQGDYQAPTPNENQHNASLCITSDSLLQIDGKDAQRFMQGQFTCDVTSITPLQFSLGACCTPKGRMIASFTLSQLNHTDSTYLLSLPHVLATTLKQHLSKYAVFFKATMTDQSNEWTQLSIVGSDALKVASTLFNLSDSPQSFTSIALADTDINIIENSESTLMGQLLIHDAHRITINLPVDEAIALWPLLTSKLSVAGSNEWKLANQHAGVGHVSEQTSEVFIPQMLNLQATGGISFKKGCYTGQEIIARMQFRGSLKRSMYRAVLENSVTPASGASVFSDNKASAAGIVVSAVNVDNITHLLIVLENDKTQQTLSLSPDGQDIITLTTLPYALGSE